MKPRNPYADKLLEFRDFVLTDDRLFDFCGKWNRFFTERMNKSPLKTVLEIGCSNAEFLTSIASENPSNAYVGIDWKFKVLYKGAQKIFKSGNKNQALMRGRAQEIGKMFDVSELEEIWIFYPDPWAKKSQLKHRLIHEKFLLECACVLKPGGKIFFKTDHPGYYQWVLALFGESALELPSYDEIHAASADRFKRGMSGKQILVRKSMSVGDLPERSHSVCSSFRLECKSQDLWNDKTVLDAVAGCEFHNVPTLFERGFLAQKLPIYFVEMKRKS